MRGFTVRETLVYATLLGMFYVAGYVTMAVLSVVADLAAASASLGV